MIYDYSAGFENAKVMVADTGKLVASTDKQYLTLDLYNGESFENLEKKQQRATGTTKSIPYRRETFSHKRLVIDFATEFNRYDESILDDQHVSKDVTKLVHSIDSMQGLSQTRCAEQSEQLIRERYFGRENRNGTVQIPAVITKEERASHNLDSLWSRLSINQHLQVLTTAQDRARTYRDQIEYNAIILDDADRYIRKHEIELYRRFTLAFACLVFFFIGAPLGTIIRKGGLGAPVVISVILFIVYYIIDNTGYKMAREAIWPCWAGMWLSSFILLPTGIFLTYKAATDSPLFNPEAWTTMFQRFFIRIRRKD